MENQDSLILALIIGEVGGIGKSTVALLLADYLIKKSGSVVVVETDIKKIDVGRACNGKAGYKVYRAQFSENRELTARTDKILKAPLRHQTHTVVNCAANSSIAIHEWFSSGSADFAEEMGIKIIFFFVTNGSSESIELFNESLEALPFPHVFVRNLEKTREQEFDHSDRTVNEELYVSLASRKVPVVEIPRFNPHDIKHISSHYLTFTEASTWEWKGPAPDGEATWEDDPNSPELDTAAIGRVRRVLKTFNGQLDQLEVFND